MLILMLIMMTMMTMILIMMMMMMTMIMFKGGDISDAKHKLASLTLPFPSPARKLISNSQKDEKGPKISIF